MTTYNRNGVQIEQCHTCRGIFLDHGELEHLSTMESQWAQPAPYMQGGHHGGGHYGGHYGHRKHKSMMHMLFSS